MNKNEVILKMAEKTGLAKKDCEMALSAFLCVVEDSLKAEEPVRIVGFGNFEVRHRAARTGRNPKTNEAVEIPETKLPVFRAGKSLKDAIH